MDSIWRNNLWSEFDRWWDTYRSAREKEFSELLAEMKAADRAWAAGDGQINADPLSKDWQTAQGSTGPIRISREEDWSYGLAHLLRSGDGQLITELIGEMDSHRATSVKTEAHLPGGEETTRYEDILLTGSEGGISVEVKVGDTNLQKTLDTAALVEKHYNGDWTHVLLLPKHQRPALEETFGNGLFDPESGSPIVRSEQSADVKVRYWREVSAALRTILQRGCELNPHWIASAYVFCTLIEQRIMGLIPRPIVERLSNAAGVVDDEASLSIEIGDIENEIEYLQATTEEKHHG
jgi:hypothetical protein